MPAGSDIETMDDLVAKLKADPGAVSWGGGSAGGTDHIAAGLIAKAVGVDPTKVNYIAFSGGGEALAAILGGQVTVGVSGFGEFESQIEAGTLRLLAVSGDERDRGRRRADAEGGRRRRRARELAHGRGRAGHHRRGEGGDHRRHREARHLRRLEAGARDPRLGRPLPGRRRLRGAARRRHRGDRRRILNDIGLVQ